MPSRVLSSLRRVLSFLPRCRTILFLSLGLGTIVVAFIAYVASLHLFQDVLPMRRAYYLETLYLFTMGAADLKDYMSSKYSEAPEPDTQPRVQGLIQDAPQLHYWSIPTSLEYGELLGLHFDGTGWGESRGREYWIYFGGTTENTLEPKDEEEDATVFKHRYKTHSSKDPPHISNAFNAAFNRVVERWHGINRYEVGHSGTSKAVLRYVDCDVSPLICTQRWGFPVNPVMLVHLKIGHECDLYLGQVERCPVRWRFFGLPMRTLPWTRQIRIPLDKGGSTVVPAFPDAEEQLWTLMAFEGAEEGYKRRVIPGTEEFGSSLLTVDPMPDGAPRYSAYLGLEAWALLSTYLRYPLGWPRELLIRCYLERWLDQFLRWWDGSPYVVNPRSCSGIEERHERNQRMMSGREKLINSGVDPKNIFIDW